MIHVHEFDPQAEPSGDDDATEVPGRVFEFKPDPDRVPQHINYASVTAPGIVRVEVRVSGKIVDVVYAGNGGSHSWWASGGGPLCEALGAEDVLEVFASGKCAFRFDT